MRVAAVTQSIKGIMILSKNAHKNEHKLFVNNPLNKMTITPLG